MLHYDNGFTLIDSAVESSNMGSKSCILWHFPFEKLRMSADDGMRLLWLDFGEDGEQVSRFYVWVIVKVVIGFPVT